jgi:hypothetical protein
LHDYNVPERVQTFIQAAQNEASGFATNHIMMTMGNDFHYENANEWFKNLDKLIRYVNAQVCIFIYSILIYLNFSKLMVVISMSSIQHHHVICML